jgi:hypothetical protein
LHLVYLSSGGFGCPRRQGRNRIGPHPPNFTRHRFPNTSGHAVPQSQSQQNACHTWGKRGWCPHQPRPPRCGAESGCSRWSRTEGETRTRRAIAGRAVPQAMEPPLLHAQGWWRWRRRSGAESRSLSVFGLGRLAPTQPAPQRPPPPPKSPRASTEGGHQGPAVALIPGQRRWARLPCARQPSLPCSASEPGYRKPQAALR